MTTSIPTTGSVSSWSQTHDFDSIIHSHFRKCKTVPSIMTNGSGQLSIDFSPVKKLRTNMKIVAKVEKFLEKMSKKGDIFSLCFDGTVCTEAVIPNSCRTKVVKISCKDCKSITLRSVEQFLQFPKIQELYFGGCKNVNEKDLVALVKILKLKAASLKILSLVDVAENSFSDFSGRPLQHFFASETLFPKLEVIDRNRTGRRIPGFETLLGEPAQSLSTLVCGHLIATSDWKGMVLKKGMSKPCPMCRTSTTSGDEREFSPRLMRYRKNLWNRTFSGELLAQSLSNLRDLREVSLLGSNFLYYHEVCQRLFFGVSSSSIQDCSRCASGDRQLRKIHLTGKTVEHIPVPQFTSTQTKPIVSTKEKRVVSLSRELKNSSSHSEFLQNLLSKMVVQHIPVMILKTAFTLHEKRITCEMIKKIRGLIKHVSDNLLNDLLIVLEYLNKERNRPFSSSLENNIGPRANQTHLKEVKNWLDKWSKTEVTENITVQILVEMIESKLHSSEDIESSSSGAPLNSSSSSESSSSIKVEVERLTEKDDLSKMELKIAVDLYKNKVKAYNIRMMNFKSDFGLPRKRNLIKLLNLLEQKQPGENELNGLNSITDSLCITNKTVAVKIGEHIKKLAKEHITPPSNFPGEIFALISDLVDGVDGKTLRI